MEPSLTPQNLFENLNGTANTSAEFFKQNDIISKEIHKYDSILYCSLIVYRILLAIYIAQFTLLIFLNLNSDSFWLGEDIFPPFFHYIESSVKILLTLFTIYGCIITLIALSKRNPSNIHKALLIFKLYLGFTMCYELPIFLFYCVKTGWDWTNFLSIAYEVVQSFVNILLAIRVRNALEKVKAFYDVSSYHENVV